MAVGSQTCVWYRDPLTAAAPARLDAVSVYVNENVAARFAPEAPSVSQRLPSAPFAIPVGALDAVGVGYSVTPPDVVTRAIREAPLSASHRSPSAPTVMAVGDEPVDGTG